MDAHPYSRLTPDLVLDAVAAAGLAPDGRLLTLNSYENRVYQVGLDDGTMVVAKFYRPGRWTDAQIDEEHAFARELASHEIPVVAPLHSLSFGGFRVALNYGVADTDVPGGGSVEHEAMGLGLGAKIGVGEVLFNYIQQEVDLAGDPEAKSFGIAYVHPVSKRTNFYVSYGQLENDGGANFTLRSAGNSVGDTNFANTEPKAFAVGIRHMF